MDSKRTTSFWRGLILGVWAAALVAVGTDGLGWSLWLFAPVALVCILSSYSLAWRDDEADHNRATFRRYR